MRYHLQIQCWLLQNCIREAPLHKGRLARAPHHNHHQRQDAQGSTDSELVQKIESGNKAGSLG